jgi:hypothetical protein
MSLVVMQLTMQSSKYPYNAGADVTQASLDLRKSHLNETSAIS